MKYIITYFTLLLAIQFSVAQNPHVEITNKSNGLPSNTVYDIFQDRKGFMWFSTAEGLVKYDGFEMKTFLNSTTKSAEGSCIREDSYGRIWYVNFDGYLLYIQNDSIHDLKQSKTRLTYYQDFGIINNQLYVVQKKGIDIFSLKSLKKIKTILIDLKTDTINVLCCRQSNNCFYVLTDYVYTINSSGKIIKYDYIKPKTKFQPNYLIPSKNGIVPVCLNATDNILYKFKNNGYVSSIIFPVEARIHLVSYTDNKFWFCTPNGVYVFNENGEKAFRNNYLFANKNISSVFKDREGGFWFSTLNEGLFYINDMKTKRYFEGENLSKLCIIEDELFISTKKGVIHKLNLQTFNSKPLFKERDQSEITFLYIDKAEEIIFYSTRIFNAMNLSGKKKKDLHIVFKDLVKINDKYYAFASSGSCGLVSLNSNTLNEWDVKPKQKINQYFSVSVILQKVRGKSVTYNKNNNAIYYATNYGLYKVLPKKTEEIKYKNSSLYVLRLYNYLNTVYALTFNGDVYEINEHNELTNLSQKYNIIEGSTKRMKLTQHYLFLISDNNIQCVDLISHHSEKININNFEVNDIELYHNELILSTSEGLITQSFKGQHLVKAPPLFQINWVKVNNSLWDVIKNPALKYNQNNIEINYSILSFKPNKEWKLFYKINNSKWELAPLNSRSLKFAALKPDRYTVSFKFGNNQKQNCAVLNFIIKKPYWLSWQALLIYFLLFIFLLLLLYKWQTNFITKKNKLLKDKIILERQLNQSILKSIKAQMNPHFFYNALNTIQSYIYSNEKSNAAKYLSKFSKLTRLILEMSENETVKLSDEIYALKLYLDIEEVRFTDKMSYEINISETIDLEMIKIPSMLIQPYVENAINHGLLHKKGKKILEISFEQKETSLQIQIEDNGIGRKKSEELNKIKNDKNQSFSSIANLKRIELLNSNNQNVGLKIIDKMDGKGEPTGTKVIIIIPI